MVTAQKKVFQETQKVSQAQTMKFLIIPKRKGDLPSEELKINNFDLKVKLQLVEFKEHNK